MKKATHRTKKGLIEVELSLENNSLTSLKITGDFFIYPEEAIEIIEQELLDLNIDEEQIEKRIKEIYEQHKITTPLITIYDCVTVIMKAINL
jgi:lipoate-protein ligase A